MWQKEFMMLIMVRIYNVLKFDFIKNLCYNKKKRQKERV